MRRSSKKDSTRNPSGLEEMRYDSDDFRKAALAAETTSWTLSKTMDSLKALFHGVRVVPIKPTGVVMVRGKPVVIIPGHAVSALLTLFTLALPILNALSGLKMQSRKVVISAETKDDIINERPIDALCLVRLEVDAISGIYRAIPLDWGSNLVSNLSRD